MGHATANFTLNVYAHTSEQMMKDTAARAQSYYDKALKKGMKKAPSTSPPTELFARF